MDAFEDDYQAWREYPFPVGSARDDLDELHADLVWADTWVADTLIPFVQHGRVAPVHPTVDFIASVEELRDRSVEMAASADGLDHETAVRYREYAELLLRVYSRYLAESQTSRHPPL
jgi:streptogramin lyase